MDKFLSGDWLQMCTLVKGSPWGYAVMVNSEVKWTLKVMVIFKNFNKEKNAVYTFPTTCREWKKKLNQSLNANPAGKSLKISITLSSRIEIFTYAMIDLYLHVLCLL